MFTGIVEALGRVRSIAPHDGGARLVIEADGLLEGLATGDSVAVNGCCLTATEVGKGWFGADAVVETMERTCLAELDAGDDVNLERPVVAGGRLDGHIVQGHVDATGTIEGRDAQPDGSFVLRVAAPPAVGRYLVEKGSVAVDGVSLTVVAVEPGAFTVALIPHTAEVTTLGRKPLGAAVNLEVDVVAKYVERLLTQPDERSQGPSGPTERGSQGPSGPTERGSQGPSGPTERGES